MAIGLARGGDVNDAACTLRRAADLSPDALSPRLTLAQLYNENGSYPLAVRTYRRVLEFTPDDVRLHSTIGAILRKLGDLRGAVESARAVVAIDNTSAAAHLNLGTALEAVMLGAENRTDPAYQPALDEAVAAFTRAQSLGLRNHPKISEFFAVHGIEQAVEAPPAAPLSRFAAEEARFAAEERSSPWAGLSQARRAGGRACTRAPAAGSPDRPRPGRRPACRRPGFDPACQLPDRLIAGGRDAARYAGGGPASARNGSDRPWNARGRDGQRDGRVAARDLEFGLCCGVRSQG